MNDLDAGALTTAELAGYLKAFEEMNEQEEVKLTAEEFCAEHLGGLDLEVARVVLKNAFPENFV
jgi:hypothetical protein